MRGKCPYCICNQRAITLWKNAMQMSTLWGCCIQSTRWIEGQTDSHFDRHHCMNYKKVCEHLKKSYWHRSPWRYAPIEMFYIKYWGWIDWRIRIWTICSFTFPTFGPHKHVNKLNAWLNSKYSYIPGKKCVILLSSSCWTRSGARPGRSWTGSWSVVRSADITCGLDSHSGSTRLTWSIHHIM